MNNKNLKLCIIPSDVPIDSVEKYTQVLYGKVYSSTTDIKVNKIPDGYSILYLSDNIKNMDIDVLTNNIVKLFMENVHDTIINVNFEYFYEVVVDDEVYNNIDLTVANVLLSMESKFFDMNKDPNSMFRYSRSDSMVKLIESIISNYNDIDNNEDEYYEEDETDEVDDYDNPVNDFFESIGITTNRDEEIDDEDDESDIIGYKSKNKSSNYPQSRILKDSKNAKRAYNRHGVLICNNKKSRKRDEKIIKEFLKDFIPGDAEWKKEFRHDILKRWMKMYSISKNDLKELEKAHNKAQKSKHNTKKLEKTLEFTSRLFNRSTDRWSDPNR